MHSPFHVKRRCDRCYQEQYVEYLRDGLCHSCQEEEKIQEEIVLAKWEREQEKHVHDNPT